MAYKQLLIRIVFLATLLLVLDKIHHQASILNALNFLPPSRLVKLASGPTVYYVNQNRLKIAIPSAQVFLSYGGKWSDIEIIEQSELDFYKDAEYIKLIGDARVYQLKNGVKRYLTQKAASALKIFPEEVIPVNKTEFNVYAKGATLDENEAKGIRAQKDALVIAEQENQKCVPDPNVGGEDGCKIFEAMETKDSSACDDIESEEWKAKCYMSVVPESGDYLANCKKLSDGDFKNQCISQTALAKNNSLLCSEIFDAGKKQFCESGIKISQKDLSACDSLPEGDMTAAKNFCLYSYALINSDTRACEKISVDSTYKKPCADFLNQKLSMLNKIKPNWLTSTRSKILSVILGKPASAQTDPTNIPVGGIFLAGAIDIFTPTPVPPCLLVSVLGPNPGVFNFVPVFIYDYFPEALSHISLNTVGLSKIVPPCPPALFMIGSSLVPGFY